MSLEPALLAAIAASPDDDLPRLVYADWLDENGRALRAEFIRLQIEIAKKETLPRAAVNAFAHLWKRQQEILDDHREELVGHLDNLLDRVNTEFRRGFLDRVSLTLEEFLEFQSSFAALRPTPRIAVCELNDELPQLAWSPHLSLICELSTAATEPYPIAFEEILHDVLLQIRKLLTRLTCLEVEACRLGDERTAEIFASGFPALVELDLSFNDLSDAGVIALLNTGVPQRLKRLVLGGNPIGDQAAMELTDRLGGSTVLENLTVRMTNIGPNGQAALLARLGGRVDLF